VLWSGLCVRGCVWMCRAGLEHRCALPLRGSPWVVGAPDAGGLVAREHAAVAVLAPAVIRACVVSAARHQVLARTLTAVATGTPGDAYTQGC
jgi:hypothetical protein